MCLTPGATVAEVINLDEIDVLCHVPPRAARLLDLKQEARVAGTKQPVGHIVYVAEQAQPEKGSAR